MGAWSHEPFGNDTAADWAWGLDDSDDLEYIENTLAAVEDEEELDASLAEEAIAAIDVLAKALGKGTPPDAYSDSAMQWIERVQPVIGRALRERAIQVLNRIVAEDSELRALWEDSDDYDAWQASVAALRQAMHEQS
jgi:Domain of unknown function (DUF4259)